MKVTETSLTEEEIARCDGDVLTIDIDGDPVFRVVDGEPEDANLRRDFNDCWKIIGLMRSAYDAGVKGEPFEYKSVKVEDL